MEVSNILELNEIALSQRFSIKPEYKFCPVSSHDKELHRVRHEYPYFGYIDILIDGVKPFVMFSNNDDLVAQTYFFYGANSYETLSIHIWQELAKQSNSIFDIGGYTGLYTLVAAHINPTANLFVFEPVKKIFGRLIMNLAVNRLGTRVKAVDLAISNTSELLQMNIFQGNLTLSTGSSLIEKGGKTVYHKEYVECIQLDNFLEKENIEKVELLKIDVEQAECLAIEGMMDTIKNCSPQILIEVTTVQTLFKLYEKLSTFDYNFVVINDRNQKAFINSFDAFGIGSKTVHNILFTPLGELEIAHLFDQIKGVKLYSSQGKQLKNNENW